ncbi:MAG: hypothetical protein AAB821_02790 [Patescibacteria group bacterium]
MRKDKNIAINLRKSGQSYKEIEEKLKIPKSTLSAWFKNQNWSRGLALNLAQQAQESNRMRIIDLNNIRGKNLAKVYQQATEEAIEDCIKLQYHPLFIAGVMLYWGEGDKVSKNLFRISNSDPLLIKIFVEFIEKICRIPKEKIRASILLYPDLDEESVLLFWKQNAGLKDIEFYKSSVILGKSTNKRTKVGVCTVYVSSSYLKKKMVTWIENLPKMMMKDDYFKAGIV